MRKEADLYKKVVYWSDEDEVFIGVCPELMYGGVHGNDPVEVFKDLSVAVDEIIEIMKEEGKPLPAPKDVVFEPAATV
jgi:predicted RNase H-like HicB family nuclease